MSSPGVKWVSSKDREHKDNEQKDSDQDQAASKIIHIDLIKTWLAYSWFILTSYSSG